MARWLRGIVRAAVDAKTEVEIADVIQWWLVGRSGVLPRGDQGALDEVEVAAT